MDICDLMVFFSCGCHPSGWVYSVVFDAGIKTKRHSIKECQWLSFKRMLGLLAFQWLLSILHEHYAQCFAL